MTNIYVGGRIVEVNLLSCVRIEPSRGRVYVLVGCGVGEGVGHSERRSLRGTESFPVVTGGSTNPVFGLKWERRGGGQCEFDSGSGHVRRRIPAHVLR